jgi:hypothetical protein
MKLMCATFGIVAMCTAGAVAQTQTIHEQGQRKIEVKDGQKITVAGCLARNPGGGYMITNEEGGMKYVLVTDRNLAEHVGHWMEIRGKATDRGDAKVKIESKGTAGTGDDKHETDAKTTLEGNLGLKYLGVDHVKTLSKTCR